MSGNTQSTVYRITRIDETKSLTEKDSKAKDYVEEFICRLKQYADAPELTREMCVNLIQKIKAHPAIFRSITSSLIMGL